MRPGRILLAALVVVAVGVPIGVAWRMPELFDPNRYRDTITAVVSSRLGRPVTIAGPIHLSLLPAPELAAEQVDIGGDAHGGNGFHVAALRLRVGLGSLLRGRVDARELVLRGPDLWLPWPLPQSVLASRPPPWLSAFAARIEGGTVHLGALSFTDIDATVAQTMGGELSGAGSAHLGGRAGRFTFHLGTPGGDGTASLDMALDGMDKLAGTGASFTGTVAADGSLDGHVTARGTDLALQFGAPSMPFRAEGRLTVGDGLAAMDEASFDLAGAPASGAVALRLTPIPRLDVALSATRLDLDPWLAALLPAAGANHDAVLPIGLDLAVEAARLGGGMVQHLRARADADHGTVRLTDVTAILPGGAQFGLTGTVESTATHAPRLVGIMRLDAPALRTTLRWLTDSGLAKLPLPPESSAAPALSTAAFNARLRVEPGSFALDDVAGRVDGVPVTGNLLVDGGPHPAIALDAATERLALDPFLSGEAIAQAAASPARWLSQGGPARLFGDQTARITLHAEHATLHGLAIRGLVVDAVSADGQLDVRLLEGIAESLRFSAAGSVSRDGRVTDAKLSLNGPSAAPLATLAGFGTPALWQGPIALEVQGGGPAASLSLGLALDLGDARLEAQPVIDLSSGAWHASASLRHPGAARLVRTLGLSAPLDISGPGEWLGDGSLSLVGQFSQTPARDGRSKLSADNFQLTAGTLRASGRFALDGRQFSGAITADSLPLPWPDLASQSPLAIAALHDWRGAVQVQAAQIVAGPMTLLEHAMLTMALNDGMLGVDGLTGRLDGGTLSGRASLNAAVSPPVLTAAFAVHDAVIRGHDDDPPLSLVSGRLDGSMELTASGYSPAALLATLSGSLRVTAHDGALAGFDLFGAARAILAVDARTPEETQQALRVALQSGTTSFDRLDLAAEAAHGLLRLTGARLQGPAGEAKGEGSVGLTDGAMEVNVSLLPAAPNAPWVGLQLDGSITAPSRQPELAAVDRWLAERPPPAR